MRSGLMPIALIAFAAPVLAGTPFTSYSVETSSQAEAGTNDETLDMATSPGFFGSISTAAESHWIDQWGEATANTDASTTVSITGSTTQWRVVAQGSTESRCEDLGASGRVSFALSAEFDLLAGQGLVLTGDADGGGFGGDAGFWGGGVSITIFRNGVHLLSQQYEYESPPMVDLSAFESDGANYELRISGGGRSDAYLTSGGDWSGGGFAMDITVSVIPAPAGIAPLALGGLVALRRRRA